MGNRLEMKAINKHFGGVHALRNVNFSAEGGQVHALLGENGAGKSTLMKILSGAYDSDSGEIFLDDQELNIDSTHTAKEFGISVIYQEFSLAKDLTIAENIFMNDLGLGSFRINWRKLHKRAQEVLRSLGFNDLDAFTPVSTLPVAEQQIVEISIALSTSSRVLVFDEPTAVLTDRETSRLFELIEQLKSEGVCIIYISHRLEEIFKICDFATVLKDGEFVATVNINETNHADLVHLMVGRDLKDLFPKRSATIGKTVLGVRNLCVDNFVHNVSFNVRAGEVLGISGLVGAGRTEAMRAIFGASRMTSGDVILNGKTIDNSSPRNAILSGIGMLPEDRKHQGVLLDLSILVNSMLKPINPFQRIGGFLNHRQEAQETKRLMDALQVKARDMYIATSSLSGGNQQKVAFMKWVSSECKVLILDEPTRGVDVGAKIEIYQIINEIAEGGVAVIVVSSEMNEIIGFCDRSLVMRLGEIAGEVKREDLTEKALINLAMGVS